MNLEKIKQGVIEICGEVGEFIRREGASFDRSRIEQKTVFNNLVSYVDKEAEKVLVKTLGKLFPSAGFITEEGTVEQSHEHEYNWIIDPLDGTTNFLHGLPPYAISIGLTRNGKPILGVIYDICQKQCYHAIENNPAFLDDQIIKVSAISSLSESLLATGFPYYHMDKREDYLNIINEFLNETVSGGLAALPWTLHTWPVENLKAFSNTTCIPGTWPLAPSSCSRPGERSPILPEEIIFSSVISSAQAIHGFTMKW